MNMILEFWKLTTAACVEPLQSIILFFVESKLKLLNEEINLIKKCMKSNSINESFMKLCEQKLPKLIAEREYLEASLELLKCKEN